MAAKTKSFSVALLKLVFHGEAISGLAGNAASPLASLYLSLHSADPGASAVDGQQTSEVTYAGYARIPLVRTSSGWVIDEDAASVSPVADVEFGECTAGALQTATHAGIGTSESGVGSLLYRGALSAPIAIQTGVRPVIDSGASISEV